MSSPIRRELDLTRLAARERRLRLVMEILKGREAEFRRARRPTPTALRESIAGFGEQLGDVHRRQAELLGVPPRWVAERPAPQARAGRFTPHRPHDYARHAS